MNLVSSRGDQAVYAERRMVSLVDELVHQEERDDRGVAIIAANRPQPIFIDFPC